MIKKTLFALALAASALSPASAAWRQATTKHFIITSDQSEADLRALAERVERFDSALRADRVVQDPDRGPAARVRLFVVDDVAEVRRIFGDKNAPIGGFYEPHAGGSFALMPARLGRGGADDMDAEGVLFHEYSHAFLYENFSSIGFPSWYAEGFAEFNAKARFNRDGSVDLGLPAEHRGFGLLYVTSLSIEDLLERKRKLDAAEGDAFYGRSWVLTHMLTFDPNRQGQLGKFLTALNSGRDPLEAAQTAFGSLKKLDVDIRNYTTKGRKFDYKRIPGNLVKSGNIEIRPLTAAETAILPVVLRSKRGVWSTEMANAVAVAARQAAAPYPNDPAVQVMLAEAEFDAKNYADAEAAATRALAANPNLVDALVYQGWARMEKAKAAKATDAATWREVRRPFIAASKVDPLNPLPLWRFYESYEAAGAKPTANAVAGLVQAYRIAPHDTKLRMAVARQYLTDGNAPEAGIALAPVAYDAHSREKDFAAAVREVLTAKGAAAALAEWDRLEKEAEDKRKEAEKKAAEKKA